MSDEENPAPRPVLDNDYKIKPAGGRRKIPPKIGAEAEREEQLEFQLYS